LPSFVLKRRK